MSDPAVSVSATHSPHGAFQGVMQVVLHADVHGDCASLAAALGIEPVEALQADA